MIENSRMQRKHSCTWLCWAAEFLLAGIPRREDHQPLPTDLPTEKTESVARMLGMCFKTLIMFFSNKVSSSCGFTLVA